ncbi:MAG: xanthine dehydrogenase family protein subunit M [Chloroflexi bacterium]|nr:xanthine dehydrogenase family protein subunit M [Chloroflexota bacterium]
MKPAPFDYHDPETLDEAVSLLGRLDDDVKILAGGQSLIPLLNMRLARPTALVDLGKIAELDYIREDNGGIAIGALTTQRTVERSQLVKDRLPVLYEATRLIAHPQIRNRGTIGGSLAHADPAAEYPAVALLLDADFKVRSASGERTIGAADFFVTYLTTALGPADVLTEVRFPLLAEGVGWSFIEMTRRHGDFALAGAGVTIALSGGECSHARIVLFGVDATPVRSKAAEQALVGQELSEELIASAAQTARDEIGEPLSDNHASSEFRRHLAGVMTARALTEAARRAGWVN